MIENEELISKVLLPNHLWVEGDDDYHICKHLWKHYKISEKTIEIFDKKGLPNILNGLDIELTINRRIRLGIIVDADTDLLLNKKIG